MTISAADTKKLADAFKEGADSTSTRAVRSMISAAVKRIHREFEEIPVEVRFTDRDPYTSMQEMRDQVRSTGVLFIWTGASDVPMWDPRTNWMARAVHDWQHISDQFDFSMSGEYDGFKIAAKKAPQLAPLYFSEIAMQAAVANTYGHFAGEQKIVLLPPEKFKWASSLQGLKGVEHVEFDAAQVALMRAVMPEEDIAKLFGALGIPAPLLRIESGRIYDAILQGQQGNV